MGITFIILVKNYRKYVKNYKLITNNDQPPMPIYVTPSRKLLRNPSIHNLPKVKEKKKNRILRKNNKEENRLRP